MHKVEAIAMTLAGLGLFSQLQKSAAVPFPRKTVKRLKPVGGRGKGPKIIEDINAGNPVPGMQIVKPPAEDGVGLPWKGNAFQEVPLAKQAAGMLSGMPAGKTQGAAGGMPLGALASNPGLGKIQRPGASQMANAGMGLLSKSPATAPKPGLGARGGMQFPNMPWHKSVPGAPGRAPVPGSSLNPPAGDNDFDPPNPANVGYSKDPLTTLGPAGGQQQMFGANPDPNMLDVGLDPNVEQQGAEEAAWGSFPATQPKQMPAMQGKPNRFAHGPRGVFNTDYMKKQQQGLSSIYR
jgi:hypothetical protein